MKYRQKDNQNIMQLAVKFSKAFLGWNDWNFEIVELLWKVLYALLKNL